MHKIKIKRFKLTKVLYSFYSTDRPMFTLCYIPDKTTDKIKTCGSFSSCRAYITDMLRTMILKKRHPNDGHSYHINKHGNIKLNDVLLCINYNTNVKKILNIIRIINYYNVIGKIPKFKLVGLSSHNNGKLVNIFILRIPMKYKEKPFLMSMATLLIRLLTTLSNEALKKIKSIDDIEEYFFTHRDGKDNNFTFNDRRSLYTSNNYLKLRLIMKNHKKLFYGLGKKTLFPYNIGYSFHERSGINSLCTGLTFNYVLNKRLKEMLKVKEVNK